MKRTTTAVIVLLAGMLVSCGGGGNGDARSGSGGGDGDARTASRASAGMHVEESDPSVTLSGEWTQSSPDFGLSGGPHTLTIEVTGRANHNATGNAVVVDAFDVQGQIVTHVQQTNPEVTFTAGWDEAMGGPWSAGGVSNPPEPTQGAKMSQTP